MKIAKYAYERQKDQIAEALRQVYSSIKTSVKENEIQVIVTGLSWNLLAREAAKKVGVEKIVDLSELVGIDVATVSTAVAVAWMTASKLEGRTVQWTP